MTLDTEQLIALSAPLVETPLPWSALSYDQREAFRTLMPRPSFTAEQRTWLALWWLPVDETVLQDLNTLAPVNTRFTSRPDLDGQHYVSADLLSDALDGGRLAALLPILSALPLTYRTAEDWPLVEPE